MLAAERDGITFERRSHGWLTGLGHLDPAIGDGALVQALVRVFSVLGGVESEFRAKPQRRLPGGLVHAESGTLIEVDEPQHFTTFRLATLDRYPHRPRLGYDLDEYRQLCETHRRAADQFRRTQPAPGFPGHGGRARQRAYNDALRDLAAPALGHPPVLRVPAPDGDGDGAYTNARHRLLALVAERGPALPPV